MPRADSTPQSKKFKEAAREAECDERPEVFDRALKKVAKVPPKAKSKG